VHAHAWQCASLAPVVLVAGVDGRRGGWAVALVRVDADGDPADVMWVDVPGQDADGFRRVLAIAGDAAAVGVDCPIGLPRDGWRPVDLAAKRRLGPASARVFLAPPRPVLAAPTYTEARAVARSVLGGRGVSAQTYGLRRIILAIDEVLTDSGGLRGAEPPVCEVHPELSFMALAGRTPGDPLPSKKTDAGRAARLAALGGWAPGPVDRAPPGDDGLDALVAAWSAWRFATGHAEIVGGEPDDLGVPMRMVV
jgi:predicted RNase H-like nuclease